MNSINEATNNEQMDDLNWALLVLMGAMSGANYANVSAASNLVEEIATRGEPQAKQLALNMMRSYQNPQREFRITKNGLFNQELPNNSNKFNFLKLVS
jgi:hypothetical protein